MQDKQLKLFCHNWELLKYRVWDPLTILRLKNDWQTCCAHASNSKDGCTLGASQFATLNKASYYGKIFYLASIIPCRWSWYWYWYTLQQSYQCWLQGRCSLDKKELTSWAPDPQCCRLGQDVQTHWKLKRFSILRKRTFQRKTFSHGTVFFTVFVEISSEIKCFLFCQRITY